MTMFPLIAKATADLTGFISSFAGGTAALAAFTSAAGAAATGGATLAVAGLVPAVGAAADFEAAMTRIVTLVGLADDQVSDFSNTILELAPSLGFSPTELARGLEAITSGGEHGAEAMDLLVASAKAARVGLGDVADVGRVGTAILQAYGRENITAERAVDIMITTVRDGAAEADELAMALGRVVGIAAQMGVSFEEVGAFIATFTRLGVSAEVASTSLRAILFAILSPGEEAKQTFNELGLSVEELRDILRNDSIVAAFNAIVAAAGDNQEALGNMIPNIRAMAGFLGTAGVQAESFAEILGHMHEQVGVTDEVFGRVQENTTNSFDRLKSSISSLITTVGGPFLDPVQAGVDLLAELVEIGIKGFEEMGVQAMRTGEMIQEMSGFESELADAAERLNASLIGMKQNLEAQPTEVLTDMLDQVNERQRLLGQMQKDGNANPEILLRQSRLVAIEAELNKILGERALLRPKEIGGLRVIVGQTEDQETALNRLIDSLDEELLKAQGRERQIILNTLAENDATAAQREHILTTWDQIRAIEAQQELEEKLARQREENEKTMERLDRARHRRESSTDQQVSDRRRAEADREANIASEIALDEISRNLDRKAQLVQEVSRAMTGSFGDIIDGTKSVAEAFEDMVGSIISSFLRLKVEQAILPLLNNMFMPIPDAPGAFQLPDGIDPTFSNPLASSIPSGAGGVAAIGASKPSPTFIVSQDITFAPNLIDGTDGAKWLESQKGTIATIVGESVNESFAMQRQLSGGGR